MRGKIFDDLMLFIGYYLPIFIITLAGVIFILTSIFKFYHINNPSQYYISIQNQNSQNNQNISQNTINSTIMVNIYYQNGFNIYYVPSFIENLSNWSIFYNITNTYPISNSSNITINPPNITNTNSTSFEVSAGYNVELESIINLSNNTLEGNNVIYTYNETTYECKIVGNNVLEYQAGSFAYFCILCEPVSGNNPSTQNYYLNEPEYINITPAISLLGNSYPNTQYYNYTVNNIEIVNGTYLAIPLSNSNGGYSMEDFQNILVVVGPPLSDYIQTYPYFGDNVVFLVNYDGKYYALPSWYAGKDNNGNYYFFINLLNIPSLYNSNFGCNIISIFVGFSNESLLQYLNGTIGGAPEALDPNNASNATIYDNGLNVFPIYVNFYPYNGSLEEQEISCNNGYIACFINNQSTDVLPTYNNISIYVNRSQYDESGVFYKGSLNIQIVTNGPLQGLLMDNGTDQGSYALITSNVLQNTFNQLVYSQSQEYQNGLGLQTFVYFSGIPWEHSPSKGGNPEVADAVVLSYVTNNSNLEINTIQYYNWYDTTNNSICKSPDCLTIGINVGGDTYLPSNFPVFMYEYGWTYGGPGPGYSPGYYVGILQFLQKYINGNTLEGYFLNTQYTNNLLDECNPLTKYYDYYYSGVGYNSYYFLEVNCSNGGGYEGSNYFAFMPQDQRHNKEYYQYGVFWLYNWFQPENNNENNNMNIFFLMNGNIYNYSLASEQYMLGEKCYDCLFGHCLYCSPYYAYAIPPAPPGNISTTGEPIFVQSYINAYNTAFNQETSNFSGI
ncbi:MAG: hypothetical protein RXO65_00915, partial [Candidatus Nanopusillus acidilobi]